MGQPRSLLSFNFGLLRTNIITNFTTNICEKCSSSIQCWDSNPRPSEHESPPITTRPGLPPWLTIVCGDVNPWNNPNQINLFQCSEVAGVKVPDAADEFPAGTPAVVSGWGVTDSGSTSDVLMAVNVKIDSDAGKIFNGSVFPKAYKENECSPRGWTN